jgi:hypothetical protein
MEDLSLPYNSTPHFMPNYSISLVITFKVRSKYILHAPATLFTFYKKYLYKYPNKLYILKMLPYSISRTLHKVSSVAPTPQVPRPAILLLPTAGN